MPTLYHDLVHAPRFAATDVSSVRKLGFAGASMTDGLLKKLQRRVPARPVRQSLRQLRDLHLHHRPERAGQARLRRQGRHQPAHPVVKLDAQSPDDVAATGEEGEIIALLAGDESFEGYWRRPDADAKALRQGWYFTGDTGFSTPTATCSSPAASTT